ncbi:MAG: ubiquinone/menaquinone biosynthesis methyltransferase [Chloroflexi bacterium]|nr:ubiquinone/menaquinone biosynthesis methyltransferase [Chloroflexota bacterium]
MFSRLAPRYDLGNRVLSLGLDSSWRRSAARLAQPGRPGLVLDVATGTADLALAVARLGSRVVALDFCEEMLQVGMGKGRKAGPGVDVAFLLGDALSLPFPLDTFDAVTIGFGMRNIPDLARYLAEVRRVLKPGGRLVTLELYPPAHGSRAHRWYLKHVVPGVGGLLSGQGVAYEYLHSSIRQFSTPEELRDSLRDAGFGAIEIVPLHLRAAMVHLAIK